MLTSTISSSGRTPSATGRVSGASATGESAELLRGMLARFSDEAEAFVRRACHRMKEDTLGADRVHRSGEPCGDVP
jgi:hypothetical protein